MKELVVISGKGGTGKTSITASFAALAKNAVMADCDVDAADLHLILEPTIISTHNFQGIKNIQIDPEKCVNCGKCTEYCQFDAIVRDDNTGKFIIDQLQCECCGLCKRMCPADAIDWQDTVRGQHFISDTRFGPFVHAKLGYAEENSGKLVTVIRKEAAEIAKSKNKDLIIVDGSPGIGCPVISSIGGCDMVLIVTEPSVSGKHDMERVLGLVNHFGIKAGLCINKYDINPQMSDEMIEDAKSKGAEIMGQIPYDTDITKAQTQAKSIVEFSDGPAATEIRKIWDKCLSLLNLAD